MEKGGRPASLRSSGKSRAAKGTSDAEIRPARQLESRGRDFTGGRDRVGRPKPPKKTAEFLTCGGIVSTAIALSSDCPNVNNLSTLILLPEITPSARKLLETSFCQTETKSPGALYSETKTV